MERLSDFILRVYPLDGVPFKRRALLHCIFWLLMFGIYWTGIGFPGSTIIYKLTTSLSLLISNIIFFYVFTYVVFALNYNKFSNYLIAILSILVFYVINALVSYYRIVLIVEHNWLSATRNTLSATIFEYYKGGIMSFFKFSDVIPNFAETILTSLPAFFVKFTRVFSKNLTEKKQLEIDYLKSQINPHFLVNTLNNIYSLTIMEDARSGDAILALSNMLNYILYETNEEKVSLEKEIKFLTDFIALERIRNSKKLKIDFDISGIIDGHIAPMILITFVENAFKHSVGDSTMMSSVKIDIKVSENTLDFLIENTKPTITSEKRKIAFGGIGLTNVKRRLTSLYRNNHTLQVKDERNLYTVNLILQLK
jgi:two-component system, LytTR family, sensor kinase